MTEIRFEPKRLSDPTTLTADVLILPVGEGEQDAEWVRRVDRKLGGSLAKRIREAEFRGQEGKSLLERVHGDAGFRLVFLVGTGKPAERTLEGWRRAIAAGARAARGEGCRKAAVFFAKAGTDEIAAAAEAIDLSAYKFDRYRQPPKDEKPELASVVLASPQIDAKAVSAAVAQIRAVDQAVCFARDLVNEPPSILTATVLADRTVAMCKGSATKVEVMGPREIRRNRLNGLIAVNKGSIEEPRFLRMRYRPSGRSKIKVAVVGKGITFDSGGLSLKPAGAMETMKQDMAGAAAVCALMAAIGRVKPANVEVTGYVSSTDNLPSGSAQKPGDVIRYRNGKTVEVLNTDAEGRLVLADALILASEEKHDVIIDLATLTGACRIALGTRVAGIMGNQKELVDKLVKHGEDAGEMMWPLPLVREYRDDLKSPVADIKNVGGGFAGAITAGLFLQEFVTGAAWAHLDIAGPAFADKDWAYCPRGGTGYGVRTLIRYLTSL